MNFTPSLCALVVLCATAACGSSVETEPGDDGTSSSTSAAATTGSAASSGVGSPSTTATSSSTSNGGNDPGTGGSGEGGVSTGEGGADVGTGAAGGGIPGTGGGAGTGGGSVEPFVCGQVECEPTEQCCGSQQGFACIGANESCQGAILTCQSAANCTGDDICCLQGELQNAESVCTDVCEPTQAGPLQLCETADECVEDVPCMEIFGGYKVCTAGFP